MGMCPETIKKRDGKPVPFDARKIRDAVQKANVAAQVEALSPLQFDQLIVSIVDAIPREVLPRRQKPISCIGPSTPRCASQRQTW